jgi:hypothetical protein
MTRTFVLSDSNSTVNLMKDLKLLRWLRKFCNHSGPWGQTTNVSWTYGNNRNGLCSAINFDLCFVGPWFQSRLGQRLSQGLSETLYCLEYCADIHHVACHYHLTSLGWEVLYILQSCELRWYKWRNGLSGQRVNVYLCFRGTRFESRLEHWLA